MLWGQWQVGYYVSVVLLALIVNGNPLVAVLAAALAWGFEPSFKSFVDETWGIRTDADRASKRPATTTSAKAPAKKTTNAKPKSTTRKTAAKPKPKAAAGD